METNGRIFLGAIILSIVALLFYLGGLAPVIGSLLGCAVGFILIKIAQLL